MSKTTKLTILVLSFLIASFIVVGGLGVKADDSSDDNEGSYKQLGVYSEVLSRVRTEYVEEPNISAVTNGALHGLLESLDANSSYLDPTEFKDYKQRKEGKAGIGADVSKRYGYAAVISVIPGGPADKAEIESGDIIEAIEGKSTRDMSLAEIDGRLSWTFGIGGEPFGRASAPGAPGEVGRIAGSGCRSAANRQDDGGQCRLHQGR